MQNKIPNSRSLCPFIPRKFTEDKSGSLRFSPPPAVSGAACAYAAVALNKIAVHPAAPTLPARHPSFRRICSTCSISCPPPFARSRTCNPVLVPTFFLRMKTPLIGEPADSEKLQTRMAFCIRNPSVRQEMKELREGSGLCRFTKPHLVKHKRLLRSNHRRVRHIQNRCIRQRHFVIYIEMQKPVQRTHRRHHVCVQRQWSQNLRQLIRLLVAARQRNPRNPRPVRRRHSARMRDQAGHVLGRQPIKLLLASTAQLHLQLNRVNVHVNRLVRLISQKNFHRQNSRVQRISLPEFFLSA